MRKFGCDCGAPHCEFGFPALNSFAQIYLLAAYEVVLAVLVLQFLPEVVLSAPTFLHPWKAETYILQNP
jgi:hypothetical protein